MPYIKSNDGRREALNKGNTALNAGELNYQIFYYVKKCLQYKTPILPAFIQIFVSNFLGDKPNYQKYNDLVGCLTLCQREIKRRLDYDFEYLNELKKSFYDLIDFYEDLKIRENGDVEIEK